MIGPAAGHRKPILGVSLKMYFGFQRTLTWTDEIISVVRERPDAAEVILLPTFPAIAAVAARVATTNVAVGAQDLAAGDTGAQTGEVSGATLAEIGCTFVEVGHAERRHLFGETEDVVAAKTAAALRHGLTPVLCLGEAYRQPADAAAAECVRQLTAALTTVESAGLRGRLVVAYEPHWAIGAAEPAPRHHITAVCQALRDAVRNLANHPDSAVIYGGSAGPGLLTELADHTDGLFLGRFAHEPASFAAVLDEAATITEAARLTKRIGVSA